MCIIAAKKFPGIGWVGVKNRDRNYVPTISIVQSNRRGVERLFIDDDDTRYTEGLNEYGVCVLSASLSVKSDEKEQEKVKPTDRKAGYMSPDGKKIREALYEKTPRKALESIVNSELTGCTLIFNRTRCYLLEAGRVIEYTQNVDKKKGPFQYKFIEVTDNSIVRANHGILMPEYGYDDDADTAEEKRSRKSSEFRRRVTIEELKKITDPLKMLDAVSAVRTKTGDVAYMNPIRTGDPKKKEMITTGQLLLLPTENTMHYRPIHSDVEFSYTKLNDPKSKTFFEIVSNRRLLGFKEFNNK
jgi:hypothetical protein